MDKEILSEDSNPEIIVHNCDLDVVRLNAVDQCQDFEVSHEGQSTEKPTLTRRLRWFSKEKIPFFVCHKKICPHCHFGSLGVRAIAKFEANNSEPEN